MMQMPHRVPWWGAWNPLGLAPITVMKPTRKRRSAGVPVVILSLLSIILPVFLLMGLGYVLRRRGIVGDGFLHDANRLLYLICLPCLLFAKIAVVPLTASFSPMLVLGSLGVLLLTFAGAYLAAVFAGYPSSVVGVFSQGAARGNLAYIGLAIIYYAFGDEGLRRAGLLLACLVPAVNLCSIMVLMLPHASCGGRGLLFWMRELFHNPLVVAALAGVACSLFGVHIPDILDKGLDLLVQMTLPLALLAIGGNFAPHPVLLSGPVVWLVICKNLLMPLATFACLFFLGVSGVDLAVGVLFAAMPTAMVSYVMAAEFKGDTRVAGSGILVSTLGSLLSLLFFLYMLQTWFGVQITSG